MNQEQSVTSKFRNPITELAQGLNRRFKSLSLLTLLAGIAMMALLFSTEVVNAQNCTLNANVDQVICANEVLTLSGNKGGLFQGAGLASWSQVSGPSAIITSPNSLMTAVSGIQSGNIYKFRLSTECMDGSLVYDDVSITVRPITFANAGPDQGPMCPGTGILAANASGAGETGEWSIPGNNDAGITITTPSSPTSAYSAASTSAGTSTLRWTITAANGCSSYDDISITNNGSILIVNAGADQVLGNCFSLTTSAKMDATFGGLGIAGQAGQWSVISGPNIPVITNSNRRFATMSNLIQGVYIFRWTVTGPCSSGYDEVQVSVPAPVGSGTSAIITTAGDVYCDGRTSVVLSGSYPLYANEVVSWTKTAGPAATIVSPNSPTTSITGLNGSSSYTFTYTITNPVTGCTDSTTTILGYATPPSLTLTTASPIVAPCNASSVTINYTQAGSGNVAYSIVSAPAGFPDMLPTPFVMLDMSPATISGLTINGTYVIQLRKSANGVGCSDVFQNFTVVTSATPSNSNAGTKQLLACYVVSTALVGNIPSIGIGSWSQVIGPNAAIIADRNNPSTNISGLINGLYRFRWKISGGPACPTRQSDAQVVVSTITPSPANAGPDQTVCFNTPIFLAGSVPVLNETGLWTVSPSAGVVFSPDAKTPGATVTGLVANTVYTFTWSISNGCSPSNTDNVVITTSSTEGPVASVAGVDQCLIGGTTSITLQGNDPGAGSGSWSKLSGPAATITSSGQYNSTVTGLTDGTYKFMWTITFGACAVSRDTVMITISDPVTIAVASADQDICGSTTTLTGNTPVIGTGLWSEVAGAGNSVITSPTSPITGVTGLTDGSYLFFWTISNFACPSSSDSVQINISNLSPVVPIAGPDIAVCGPSSAAMAANVVAPSKGIWSIVSGPGVPNIVNINSPVTVINGLQAGTYVFRWTSYGGEFCTPLYDDVQVFVTPFAIAGPDQNKCFANSANLSGNNGSIGTWTQVGATPSVASIMATSSFAAVASGLITGVYTFRYTVAANSSCDTPSSDEVKVTIYSTTDPASAGPDQEHCDVVSFNLTGNSAAPYTGTWTKVAGPAGGSFSPDANTPNATFTGATPGVYLFTWSIANGPCSSADEVRITNYATPTVAVAGPDQPQVCGNVATMAANLPVNGLGNWTLVSKPAGAPNPIITSTLLPNTTITNLIPHTYPGTYVFRWTISNGICASTSDDVSVTVYLQPTIADAGADQVFCNTANTTLAGNQAIIGTGVWTKISGPAATIITPTAYNTTVTGMTPGVYVFDWTTTNAPCSTSDQMTITNYGLPTIASVAGTITDICLFSAMNLVGNTPIVGTGLWTQTAGTPVLIINPTSPTASVAGAAVGTYSFGWTISNGTCASSTSSLKIDVAQVPTMALAGFDQSICNTLTATLNGNTPDPGQGTGTWSQVSGPASTINLPNNPASTITLTVPGDYIYKWEIATTAACTSSDQVKIVKNSDVVLTIPSGATICDGGVATLTVMATGGVAPYTYQWQQSNDGSSGWANVSGGSGATTPSYTTPALSADRYFRCIGTSSCGSGTSAVGHITVVPDPVITVQPTASTTICSGTTTTLSVTATNGTPSLTYQWQSNTTGCGGAWAKIAGATGSSYTTNALAQTTYYRVLVSASGNGCNTATSNCAIVYVPRIKTQQSNVAICTGGVASLAIVVDGGTATLDYQWQYSADNATWGNASGGSGANTASYTTDVLVPTTNYYYRCVVTVTSPNCGDLISNSATVTVVPDPAITVQPVSPADICAGGTTANMTITATGGTPSLIYRWQYFNGATWNNVANGTPAGAAYSGYLTASFSVTGISGAGAYQYRCQVSATGNDCNTVNSDPVTVTVIPDPVLTVPVFTIPTICQGGTTVVSSTISGGMAIPLYQWQVWSGGWMNVVNGVPAGATYTNANTLAMTISGTTATGAQFYRLYTNNSSGCDYYSTWSFLSIIPDPYIVTQPASQAICVGGMHTMSVSAAGGTPVLDYQWRSSSDNVSFTDIPGATASTYTTPVLNTTTYYKVFISSTGEGCGNVTSATATVTVVPDPYIITQPADAIICTGGTNTLSVSAAGGTPALIYQWQSSPTGGAPWTNVGANSSNYTTPALSATTYYQVVISATGNDCNTVISSIATITVVPDPSISLQPVGATICNGGDHAMSVIASGDPLTGALFYQWQSSPNNIVFTDISGANSNSFATAALVATTYYRCIVTQAPSGCSVSSVSAAVIVVPDPNIPTQPVSPAAICVGGTTTNVSLVAAGGTPSLDYQWQYFDGSTWSSLADGLPVGSVYTGANTNTYSVAGITTAGSYQYRCFISATGNGCGIAISNTITVTVVPDPAITVQPVSPADICVGGTTANMVVTANGGTPALLYQWQYWNGVGWNNVTNGTPAGSTYTGATAATFSVTGISGAGSYQYQCYITATGNDCNPVISNSVTVTLIPDPVLTNPVYSIPTICAGGSTLVSSTITGGTGTPNYQWQIFNAGINNVANGIPAGTTYTNANTLSMTISGTTVAGIQWYRLSTNNSSGCDFTGSFTSYMVVADPSITTQPTSPAAICVGGTTTNVSLVAAGGTPSLDYQWQYFNGAIWSNIADGAPAGSVYTGAKTNTFSVAGITAAGNYQYRCFISATGNGCGTVTSNTVTVAVAPDPNITNQPTSPAAICIGGTTEKIIIAASGGTPALNYQWQYFDGTGWGNVINGTPAGSTYSGSATNSFSVSGISVIGNYQYQCLVTATGSDCNTTTSNAVSVTVNSSPVFSVCPSDISQNTDASQCNAVVNYTATAIATPTPAITYAFTGATTASGNGTGSGSNFNKGITNVTLTATNSCGTATCNFTVTITDTELPVISTCAASRAINGCSTSAITGPSYSVISVTSSKSEFENLANKGVVSDNCGITSVTYIDVASGSCPITVTRTWTIKDAAGNSSMCAQTITVNDNTAPTAICKNITVPLNASGVATITATDINNGSTDNCGIAAVVVSKNKFFCSDIGPNTVTLTVTDNCGLVSTCNAIVTVTDPVPPSLSINDVTVNEPAGTATFVATISNTRTCDVTFTVNTANNTAISGSDYTSIASAIYTIPAGSTSVNISVPILNDNIAEPTETYFVNLSAATYATISDGSGLGTITDDDAVTLALNGFTTTETNATQTQNYTVSLNIPAQNDIVITFNTANATATSGTDYTAQTTVSYTIPAGSTTFNIPVDVLGDLISEPTETFTGTIALSNANGQNVSITTATAASTILDNDAASVAINDVSVNEAAGTATFTVTLTGATQNILTVNYATANGTAIQPGDYTSTSGTVTFPAGSISEATQTIVVPIINDLIGEPTETYTVNLSGLVSAGSASISDASGLGTILDNDAVTLALSGFSIAETNGLQTQNFVVSLNIPAQNDIVINFTTANVTATSGTDYTAQTAVSYTIPAGSTTLNIPADVLGDLISEPTETFTGTIAISNANGQNVSITTATATSTILDDDSVSVAINDMTVNETAVTATFTVTLTGAIQNALTVNYATANGTAVQPGDYTSTSGTVTFPAGSISGATQTIVVPIVNDLLGEPTETYTVNLSGLVSAGSASISDASGLGTILDNDIVRLALGGFSATETNATQTQNFTVTLSLPAQQDIVITFTTANTTATSGTDYTAQTAVSYTIPAGTQFFDIPVSVLGDLISEPTETFTGTIALSNANGQNVSITAATATSTILDNDAVSVAINDVSVNENAGTATFTVTLTGATQNILTVNYATANGTAIQPGDYTTSTGMVTFPAGSLSGATQTITVPIINDLTAEPTETFTVNLSGLVSPGSASISDASGLGTIIDDDAVTLTLSGFTVSEINGTQSQNFTVTLNTPAQNDIVIKFSTANGTATSGSDYTAQTNVSYTIPAGSTTFTIPVDVLGDLIAEPTETFTGTIAISNANGQNVSLATATATSTILDSGSVSVAINDVSVNESAGTATFTVTLSGTIQDALSVNFTTNNGTAIQPGDYTTSSGTVTFAAGSVSGATKTITVPIINDLVGEPTETYTVNLSGLVSTGSASISDASGLGTILDDDAVALTLSGFTVTETNGSQTGNFVVTLNTPAQNDIVISFSTANASATSGTDYTAQTAVSYTIPAGSTTLNIPATVLGDLISEPTETFTGTIAISNANGQNVSIATATATSTILDNDAVSLAINDMSVSESAGTATFTITLTGATQNAVSVNYTTNDGTANHPDDYTTSAGTITFPAGSVTGATQTIIVAIINDLIGEPTETYTVNLSGLVSAGSASISDASGLGTITDDDAVTLALSGFSATETNGTQTQNFTVTLNAPAQNAIVFTFSTANTTATAGSDYTAQTTVAYTIPAGTTTFNIPVDVLGDLISEPTETFTGTIVLTNANGQNVSITTGTATSTILDNDAVSVAINDMSVNESAGTATFTVTLTGAIQNALSVNYTTTNGTAGQPDDYTTTSGTLSFAAGTVSGATHTITVPIINDLIGEPTETYTVNLSGLVSAGSASISDASGLGTILDDDAVTLALSGFSVTETNGLQTQNFAVSLNIPAQNDIVITFTSTNVTATSGTDYTAQTAVSYTIPAGSTTFNIPVNVLGDLISEPTETFTGTIALSNANGQNVSITTATATSTILDNDAVSMAINDMTVNESAGTATFTVTLTGATQNAVSVNYTTNDGTANHPDDYTTSAGTITFPAGSVTGATQTIIVAIINDLIGEPTENYTVNLSGLVSAGSATISDASGLGTITDDDAVTLALSGFTVTETNGTQTQNFAVTLNTPAEKNIVISFTTTNGSAVSGKDYTAQTVVSYTIPAGSTTINLPVDVLGDLIAEPTETFTGSILITNLNGQNVSITTATATSTILDNDAVSIAINDMTVDESAGVATFTVTLTGTTQDVISVNYTTANGTAIQPGDYTTSAGTVTFPAGSLSGATQTITVPIINDLIGEPTETYMVNLSNLISTGSASISDASGLGTITDDDAVTLTLSGFSVTETNSTQAQNFVVTLNTPAQNNIVITFTTTNVTATSGSDYTAQTTVSYTIPAGSTTFNIPVDVLGDLIAEATETFIGTIALSNANGQNVSITTATATSTILDNDAVSAAINDMSVSESAGTATFTVTLTGAIQNALSVNFTTTNGTAIQPGDYTTSAGTVTFPAGSLSGAIQTITVPIINDLIGEPTETYTVNLSGLVSTGSASISDASGLGTILDDDAVTMALSGFTVTETNGLQTQNYTVTLNTPAQNNIVITFTTANGTATSGSDYTAQTAVGYTIPAGATTITIPVNILGDLISEPTETFTGTIAISNANGQNVSIITATATATILDNDAVSLAINDMSVSESAGTATFTVTLTGTTQEVVSVNYSTANGTAMQPGDYTTSAGTVTFPAGSLSGTTQTIFVPIINDLISEPTEAYTVNLSGLVSTGSASISDASGLGTILDDDAVTLSLSGFTVTETNGLQTQNFTVTLNLPAQNDVVISFTTANGTAKSGTDYTAQTVSYTIPAGSTTFSIPVDVLGDLISEPTENFTGSISITNANGQHVSITAATATSTILDNDAVSLAINDVTVNESAGVASFTVTITGTTQDAISINYATANGTAMHPGDYTTSTGTVTFPAGSVSGATQTINVPIISDLFAEPTETYTVNLSGLVSTGSASISDASGLGTITDDDVVTLSLSGFTVTENGSTQTENFIVSLSTAAQEDIVITFTTADVTAMAGSDFTGQTSVSYTIPAGSTTFNIPVDILGDLIVEPTETFTGSIAISNANGQNVNINTSVATSTILDSGSVSIALNDRTVNESAGTAIFTVTLTGTIQDELTVNYTTTNGTALQPGDYTTSSGTLTFPAGSVSGAIQTITVPIINDLVGEPTETYTVNLSGIVSTGSATISDASGLGTILDDDAVTLALSGFTATETNGTQVKNFTVTLNTAAQNDIVITFVTANVSATSGTDYTAQSVSYTIPAGSVTFTIPVDVLGDLISEPSESFTGTILLTNPNGQNVSIATATATSTILDNDAVSLAINDVTVNESAGTASFNVALTGTIQDALSVNYTTTNGTAVQPGDYTTSAGTVTFPAGSVSGAIQTITVPVINDLIAESTETYTVDLSGIASSGSATISDASGLGTILDDDAVTIALSGFTATETDATQVQNFTVTLNTAAQNDIVITFTTANATANAGTDFTAQTAVSYTIPAGSVTLTIPADVLGDLITEPAETFTGAIALSNANGQNVSITTATATSTILDNDAVSAAINDMTVNESAGTATFTVTLTGTIQDALSVNYTTANGTAIQPGDYTNSVGTVTFPAGSMSGATQTITVPIINDLIAEPTETYTVNLSGIVSSGSASISDASGLGRITDDDAVTLTLSGFTVTEINGTQSQNFAVTLNTAAEKDIVITFTTANGSATSGTDYTAQTTVSYTIPAGSTTFNIPVDILGDLIAEPTETFTGTIAISNANGQNVSIANATATAIILDSGSVSIAINDATVNESAVTATFTVTLSGTIQDALSVNYTTTNGTALQASDYTTSTGTVTFPAGSLSGATQNITVPVINDLIGEPTETYTVDLSSIVSTGSATISDGSGLGTILDDDAVTLTLSGFTVTETDGTQVQNFTATLNTAAQEDIVVSFITSNLTAVSGSDYTAQSSVSYTIPAGNITFMIPVDVLGDLVSEPSESFTATILLTNPNGQNVSITTATATSTVLDNDAVSLAVNDVTVNESDGIATFTVTLTGATQDAVSVNYTTTDGTAMQPGDYTTNTGTLTFAAGSVSGTILTFNVPIKNDMIAEPTETYSIEMSGISSLGNASISDAYGMGTILDDDALTLALSGFTTTETDGSQVQNFTVTLNTAAEQDIVITFTTSDGAAVAGSDYTAQSGVSYTIPAGATTFMIPAEVLGDLVSEPAESFTGTISISNANGQNVSIATGTATATILDDEIIAVDNVGSPVNGYNGGIAVADVLLNDQIYGSIPSISTVILTQVNSLDPNGIPTTNVLLKADGSVTVVPGTPAGVYTLTYQICELVKPSNCDQAIVTITVTLPVIEANDDAGSVNGMSGGTAIADVLANDLLNGAPVNHSEVVITIITPAANTGIVLNPATGEVTSAPGTPQGSYTIVYQICEILNPGNCDQAAVTITVSAALIDAIDDAGTVSGSSGGTAVPDVLTNDLLNGNPINPSDITIRFISSTSPDITLVGNSIEVAPGTPAGTYILVYEICEVLNPGNCDQASVTVTVTNNPPVVTGISLSTPEDKPITVCLPIADLDGGSVFTASICGNPANGTLSVPVVTGNQVCITYTPNLNYYGTETFCLQVCDNGSPVLCDTATITINVTPVNDAPIAIHESLTTCNNSIVTGNVFANGDFDPEGTALVAATSPIAGPFNGTFTILTNGDYTYKPASTFSGIDYIVVSLCDNGIPMPSVCTNDTITIKVSPVAIVTAGPDISFCETPANISLNGASASNYDYVYWTHNGQGKINDSTKLHPVYIPSAGEIGNIKFALTARGTSSCGTTLVSDSLIITIYEPIIVNAGDDQTIISGTATTLDAKANGGTGIFSYSWLPGEFLLSTVKLNPGTIPLNTETIFTITAFDAISGCRQSDDVKISMNDVERPIARNDFDTTTLNTPITVNVKANDSDPVALGLTVSITSKPKKGTAIVNENGTITYTPQTGSTGNDTLTYTICDKGVPSKCSSATLIITIFPIRDAFDIYNLITPNGDGQNDYWHIGGIEEYPDNYITIFNRWGDKVHEFKSYNNSSKRWDGTNDKGNILPSGTYFYIISIPNFGSLSGWLMLQGSTQ